MVILVAHDGSEVSDKALLEGYTLAGRFGVSSITVLSVVPDLCLYSEEVSLDDCNLVANTLHVEAQSALKKVSERMAGDGVKPNVLIKDGHPADKILETAAEIGADYIIVGAHGRHGARKYFMGSVASKVARHAHCKVVIAR